MIFISYEPGSKGYQFWDAAHRHFEISCDVKFKETLLPAKEVISEKLTLAPSSDQTISESDNESDHLGLDLVISVQPPTRPPSPGQSVSRQTLQKPQKQTHPNPLIAPPQVPPCAQPLGSGQEPAMPKAPCPQYKGTIGTPTTTLWRQYQQHTDIYVPRGYQFISRSVEFGEK